jgi:hypothetical protein
MVRLFDSQENLRKIKSNNNYYQTRFQNPKAQFNSEDSFVFLSLTNRATPNLSLTILHTLKNKIVLYIFTLLHYLLKIL